LVAWLVEILPDGSAGRDIGLGADDRPLYVTRPSQAEVGGPWEFFDAAPPGTPAFDDSWGTMGSVITAEEFESAYLEADATLPWTFGGTPTWISAVLLALLFAVPVIIALWWGSASAPP